MPPIQVIPPAQPPVSGGMPMVQQVQVVPTQKKDVSGLVKTIVIVILSLVAVTFIGLFIWMSMQYSEVKEDVDYQIDVAVAKAKDEQHAADEAEYFERESLTALAKKNAGGLAVDVVCGVIEAILPQSGFLLNALTSVWNKLTEVRK